MNELISVIVPVYKVEEYLPRCVDSIRDQTYRNLEIILVDDGSPDGCPALCDAYAREDSRIRVIHKENGGLSDARNVALEMVRGKFICFIDSDDYVTQDYIATLYQLLKTYASDLSVVKVQKVFNSDGVEQGRKERYPQYRYDTKTAVADLLAMGHLSHEACGKMFAAELFDGVRFPVGALYEDLAVMYRVFLRAERISGSDRPLYCYRVREGSIMQSAFDMRQYVEVRWIEEAMEAVSQHYPELNHEIRGRRIWSYFKTLYRILCSEDRAKYRKQQDETIQKIRIDSAGLLRSPRISRNLKIKIASLYFGRYGYYAVQKFSDALKQMKAGHRYTV